MVSMVSFALNQTLLVPKLHKMQTGWPINMSNQKRSATPVTFYGLVA